MQILWLPREEWMVCLSRDISGDSGRSSLCPMNNLYWSHYRGMPTDDYVAKYIDTSEVNLQRMQETVSALPAGITNLLDVGCGFGHFLRAVRDIRGISGAGVEITEEKVEYARRVFGLEVQVASVDALTFPDQSFDAVSALEVIEHLPLAQYAQGRAELVRVARRWILVSVPWREHRRNLLCPECGCEFNPNLHLRSFRDSDFPGLFPGFVLRSLAPLGEQRVAPRWFKALMARRRSVWPTFAVCPACGYKDQSAIATPTSAVGHDGEGKPRRVAWLRDRILRTQPCWYLALYERAALCDV